MNATTTVRFFLGRNYPQLAATIDRFCSQNQNWEITSVSQMITPDGGISAACSIKYKGSNREQMKINEITDDSKE